MERELSRSSKYWIPRHRYYELMHFSLQYPEWVKAYRYVSHNNPGTPSYEDKIQKSGYSDPTADQALILDWYDSKIGLVEKAAYLAHPILKDYILQNVTEGRTYDQIRAYEDIPVGRKKFYEICRAYYWHLSQLRD